MLKKLSILVFVAALSFTAFAPPIQAANLADSLKRVDALIMEMQALRTEFASLLAAAGTPAVVATPTVLGAVSESTLGDDVAFGSTNEDIKKIQTLLATDVSIYPYGVASGFFGPKTQDAIRSFQARFNLDTVGVVGPSTRALLEVFFAAYPEGNYPDGVLSKPAPVVLGASTTVVPAVVPVQTQVTTNTLKSISISEDDDEYIVKSFKANGTRNRDLILYPEDGDALVEMIAEKLSVSESEVRSLVDSDDLEFGTKRSSSRADKGDAEDALDDADAAIDDARDEIKEADDDGDDIDEADDLYDEARDVYKEAENAFDDKDYAEAVDLAEEAQKLAEDAVDELGGGASNSDDIDSIVAEVLDGKAKVVVEYDNGDDERFTVQEDDTDKIIAEIADELDISENDVEDLVEFEYGAIDKITTTVSDLDGVIRIRVYFESGVDAKFTFEEGEREDDIIEEIAKELNLRERDIESKIDFQ
jgi:tetratricopeptide (TPR) repeat protein